MAADQPTDDAANRKAEKAAYLKRYREARKAAGVCIRCGQTNDRPGKTNCSACSAESVARILGRPFVKPPKPPNKTADPRAYRRALAAQHLALGLCISCRQPREDRGRKLCTSCRARYAGYNPNKRTARAIRADAINAGSREKRRAWKQAGLCNLCGDDRGDARTLTCRSCAAAGKARMKQQADRRRAGGLCPRCGLVPPANAARLCKPCQALLRAAYRRKYERDPLWFLARQHARRARKRGNGGKFTADEWKAVKRLQGHTCLMCCRQEPEIKLTVDHVVPINCGGSNDIRNIQALCLSCNTSKGDTTLDLRPNGPWF